MSVKKRLLKRVNVNFISLVDRGANNKTIIYKSAQEETEGVQYGKTIGIKKLNEDEQIVYGIVYSPDEADSDGDFTTADVIKEMAYSFMKNKYIMNVDRQHDNQPDEGFVAETWLIEKNDPKFPNEAEGSWAVGIKVTNQDTWHKIKSGELTGLSMAGTALVENVNPVRETEDSKLGKLIKLLKESLATTLNCKNEALAPEAGKIVNTVKDANSDEMKIINEILSVVNEIKTLLETKPGEFEKRLQIVESTTLGSAQDKIIEDAAQANRAYKGPNWLS